MVDTDDLVSLVIISGIAGLIIAPFVIVVYIYYLQIIKLDTIFLLLGIYSFFLIEFFFRVRGQSRTYHYLSSLRYDMSRMRDSRARETEGPLIDIKQRITRVELLLKKLASEPSQSAVSTEILTNEIKKLQERLIKTYARDDSEIQLRFPKEPMSIERVTEIYKQMTAEFTHALMTPLATIDYAITNFRQELPRRLHEGSEVSEEKESILFSLLENATESLHDMRSILHQGAGLFPSGIENIALDGVVRKAERMAAAATGQTREVAIVTELPAIKFYRINLLLALVEILKNAIEATDSNAVIKVSNSYDENGKTIQVDISNPGPSIPPSVQAKLFTFGFSTKGDDKGYGLSLAKRSLQKVGGDIRLLTTTHDITTFRITLPILTTEEVRE